jgi:hypothetical protein
MNISSSIYSFEDAVKKILEQHQQSKIPCRSTRLLKVVQVTILIERVNSEGVHHDNDGSINCRETIPWGFDPPMPALTIPMRRSQQSPCAGSSSIDRHRVSQRWQPFLEP